MAAGVDATGPQTRCWLATAVQYRGRGTAEFTDPPGTVEGPAVVRIDRLGEQTVTLDVENPPAQGAFFYIKAAVPAANLRRHGTTNPCASVTVQSERGTFTANERILFQGGPTRAKPHQIRLRPLRSKYEVQGAGEAAYWALPLSNFILSHWPDVGRELAEHPLRLLQPPRPAAELPEAERGQAERLGDAHHHLVVFTINGRQGFIEPLPDHQKKAERLRKGRVANTINAVIVGPAHVQSVAFSDYEALFPQDVMAWLTLATGVRVGAPWVEFRDKSGQLVRRVHIPFGSPPFERGHVALPSFRSDTLGELLTCAFASPERGKSYLRVSTNQAIDSSFRNQTLEGRFVNLVRAFETLCRHHGLAAQDLLANLDPGQQAAVKGTLRAAGAPIRALAVKETDPVRRRTLEKIASRVANAAQRENDFGLAVVTLLRRLGLPDADVLQPHLAAHPVAGATNWPGLLSFLRGSVAHEAYFDLPSGRHDLYEVMTVLDHLHDVLLRILFKTLGYKGLYRPPISPLSRVVPVDWVTPLTPAGMLGYY
jgi:hypothetical protein